MELNYTLMQKDNPVFDAIIDNNTGEFIKVLEIIDERRIPFMVYSETDGKIDLEALNKWWYKRGIPNARDGLSGFLNAINVAKLGQLQLFNNGLSLSDTYWICPTGEYKLWNDVNFFRNSFSYDIGNIIFGGKVKEKIDYCSPDISNNGWLKKSWRISEGTRVLVKGGSYPNYQEPINEVLTTKLLDKLQLVPYVSYKLMALDGKACSRCNNFLDENTEFVPAFQIYRTKSRSENVSVYAHLKERCQYFDIPGALDFIDGMLQIDYIIDNTDRNLGNFGFLRDVDSLEFIGPAPLFDNGTSFCNNIIDSEILSAQSISRPFSQLHSDQIKYVNKFTINTSLLDDFPDEMEHFLMDKIKDKMDEKRKKLLRKRTENRINELNEIIQKSQEIQDRKKDDRDEDER